MGTIAELYEAVSRLRVREKIPEIIEETSHEISLLVQSQLQKGKLSTGAEIRPAYASTYYSNIKYRMNPTPGQGTPDIKFTGRLYDGIKVIANQETYSIESNVSYANSKSITQYGDNLLRLSDESISKYVDETFAPRLQQYITDVTGLTFE